MAAVERTILFAPCFLDGNDDSGSSRLERVRRWLSYYSNLKKELGFSRIFLSDDCSDAEKVLSLGATLYDEELNIQRKANSEFASIVRYSPRLYGGVGSVDNHAYCWKALYVMRSIMEKFGYDKAITVDTDTFILSHRLAHFIRDELNEGWTAFWIPKYGFPSAELHVLTPSGMHQYREFTTPHYMAHQGKRMEMAMPFTRVVKDFVGDRFGEDKAYQVPEMDYYSQAPLDIELEYQNAPSGS